VGAGALAAAGALAVVGDDALLAAAVPEGLEPPPPPHAARTSDATRDNVNVALFFLYVCFIRQTRPLESAISHR
jgi:hypothetical protein